jgi:hypothetical protein
VAKKEKKAKRAKKARRAKNNYEIGLKLFYRKHGIQAPISNYSIKCLWVLLQRLTLFDFILFFFQII